MSPEFWGGVVSGAVIAAFFYWRGYVAGREAERGASLVARREWP